MRGRNDRADEEEFTECAGHVHVKEHDNLFPSYVGVFFYVLL